MNFDEIILDCRELEAPEPMNLVVNNLSRCDNKTYIKMVHRLEPVPLLAMLESNNYSTKVLQDEKGFVIYIWSSDQKELQEYIKGL